MKGRTCADQVRTFLLVQFNSHRFKKREMDVIYKNMNGRAVNIRKQDIAYFVTQRLLEAFQARHKQLDQKYSSSECHQLFKKFISDKFKEINLNSQNINQFTYKICDIYRNKATNMNQRQLRNNQELLTNIWHPFNNSPINCLCDKYPELKRSKIAQAKCYKCHRFFHPSCFWPKEQDHIYECPFCYLTYSIPQKQVRQIIFMGYLPKAKKQKIEYRVPFALLKDKLDKQTNYEARCVKFNKKNRFELSWPDNCTLYLNKTKIDEYKPLPKNSPLKRRADEPIKLEKYRLVAENQFCIEQRNFYDFNYRQVQVDYHLVMIATVRDLSKQQIMLKLQKNILSLDDSKSILKSYFLKSAQDEVNIQQIRISLRCQFYASRIKNPSRSMLCSTHYQVFDFENFISSSLSFKTSTKKWKCPICDRRSYDIVIDKFVSELMNKQMGSMEINFNKNCEPIFIHSEEIDDQSEQQCMPNATTIEENKKKKDETVNDKDIAFIDLDSPQQGPPASSQPPNSSTEPKNTEKQKQCEKIIENDNRPFEIVDRKGNKIDKKLVLSHKRPRKPENSKELGQTIRKQVSKDPNPQNEAVHEINLIDSSDDQILQHPNSKINQEGQQKNKPSKPIKNIFEFLQKNSKNHEKEPPSNEIDLIQIGSQDSGDEGVMQYGTTIKNRNIIQDDNPKRDWNVDQQDKKANNNKKMKELYDKLEYAHKMMNHQYENTTITDRETQIFEQIYDKIMKMAEPQFLT